MSTELRGARMRPTAPIGALVLFGLAVVIAGGALAHAPEKKSREILRIQGYRAAPPAREKVVREVVLVAHGTEVRFWSTEWRAFGLELEQPTGIATPRERDRLILQGDFATLARFANARSDQLITILGEHRSGAVDLFLLALDLCPPR